MSKVYLGDGVYVDHDGYQLHLTTENGIRATNEIHLEPEVFMALVSYGTRFMKLRQRPDNFAQLSPEEQWEVDKKLGILDL